MNRIIKIMTALMLFVFTLEAQDAGKSGMAFLKIGSGARNISMGDIGSVISNDVTAVYYNPANLAAVSANEVFVSHNEWIQDTRSELVAAKFSLLGLSWGAAINSTKISGIQVRENPGAAITEVSWQYFMGSLSAAKTFGDKLTAGATIKYLYEGILSDDATGYAFDLGASYVLTSDIRLALAVRNIGSMNELRAKSTVLPTDIRLGAVYTSDILKSSKVDLTGGIEIQKYTVQDDIHINGGVEGVYDNLLAVRIGYQTMYESKGITAGAGLRWGIINFDYAINPFSRNLGSSHIVSLKITF